MSIFLKIETKKSMMSIEFSPEEIKNQYNILLDVIRDMEFDSKRDDIAQRIKVLDDTLDLLGTMMLAHENCEDIIG